MKKLVNKKEISLVLPAYNEQENIKKVVGEILKFGEKNFQKFEIIVVNDGSTDNTVREIKKILTRKIVLVNHPKNRGYGAALRSGFAKARYEYVFYTDSDGQYKINHILDFLPLIEKSDIVAGYRSHRNDPLMRIFVGYVYNLIIRILFGLKIKDIDCSFKLYKREVFKKIKLRSNTGLIDAEVLIKARKKGFTIIQKGVKHYPRVKGKTIYEVGGRNKIFALVKPSVPLNIFKEIRLLWSELK